MNQTIQTARGKLYGRGLKDAVRFGGQCRLLWNMFLAENITLYDKEKKFMFAQEMSKRLPKILKEDQNLRGLISRCANKTIEKLDRALRDSFRSKSEKRKGFPKFKKYSDRNDSFSFTYQDIRIKPNYVRLPKIGWMRVRGLNLPEDADIRTATVKQEPDGWFISIQYRAAPKQYVEPTKGEVGIDVGLSTFATLSDGTKIENPRFGRKAEKRIRRLNREKDRRRKDSVNRKRTVARLAKAHRAVKNARQDHIHKVTKSMVDTYRGFAVEDISLRGLMKTRMAKSFGDAGLGGFLRALRYKAEWAGRTWRVLPRFQRSTGVCPECGVIGPKLSLSTREWKCEGCSTIHDRDVAAAKVILIGAVGQALPEPAGSIQRKRGPVVGIGVETSVSARYRESPSNIALTAAGSEGR